MREIAGVQPSPRTGSSAPAQMRREVKVVVVRGGMRRFFQKLLLAEECVKCTKIGTKGETGRFLLKALFARRRYPTRFEIRAGGSHNITLCI